jgi:hypothetical protein
MPLKHAAIFYINRKFSKIGNYDPGALLDTIGGSTTLIELAGSLGLAEEAKLDQEQVSELLQFIDSMPDTLDVAMVAAIKQALRDGYWVQLTWQPAVDWELRMWALHDDRGAQSGVLNLFVLSPNPDAPAPVT